MKNIEKIAEELFDKLRSRFEKVTTGDQEANDTDEPGQARFFNFDFIDQRGKNYGNIMINIVDEESLKIYFSKDIAAGLDEQEQREWYNFLVDLRHFAKRNMINHFDVRDISKSNLTIRDVKQVAKTTGVVDATSAPATSTIAESKLYGSTRTSIQEFGPVRLLIRHKEAVNEEIPGARSRKIESMFIETNQGERFLMPFNKLSAGRAMAQHLAHGGQVYDEAGQHIVEMVEEMNSLAFFVRNTRQRMFEDSETQAMVEVAVDRYHNLRDDLRQMGGTRGYQHFAENFQPTLPVEEEFDIDALKERFVKKMFDDRLTQALPYVQRAYQQRQVDEQDQYIREFDTWADEVVREQDTAEVDTSGLADIMNSPLAVGIDGIDAINAIKDYVSDDQLFTEITELSRDAGTEADARPVVNQWLVDNGYPSMYEPEPSVPMDEPPVQDAESPEPAAEPSEPSEPKIQESDFKYLKRLAGLA